MKIPKGWKSEGKKLVRKIKFDSFIDGFHFVQSLVQHCERVNHHPEVKIGFDSVTFYLTSHEKGKFTEKDIELAREINRMLGEEN